MTGRVQTLRSSVAGSRPTGRQPGEIYVNWPDNQFGVINSANTAQDLLAVRFFSVASAYSAGDFVVQGGQLYTAKSSVPAGAFNPAQWLGASGTVVIADVAPTGPNNGALWFDSVGGQLYVSYTDPNTQQWVVATNGLLTALQLTGGTLTGPLILAADPTLPLGAATKQYVDSGRGNENKIINGDMRIDQRNNGSAGTAVGYTIDRWQYIGTQASKGSWGRNGSGSTLPVFPYSLGLISSSAYAPLTGDTFYFAQSIEADMVSDFQWGTTQAQPVTLSFWAASSLTGTFSGALANWGNSGVSTRSYPFTFSILTANTWTKIVITIPGDTTGTGWLMSGNGVGVNLRFDLGSGATYRAPANAWASGNFVGANGAVNVVAANAANLFLTGVKLEIGSVATPYNRQSLAKSLIDCQRYFQVIPGAFAFNSYAQSGSSTVYTGFTFPWMRATPTGTLTPATAIINCTAQAIGVQSPSLFYLTQLTTAAGYSQWSTNVSLSAEL